MIMKSLQIFEWMFVLLYTMGEKNNVLICN